MSFDYEIDDFILINFKRRFSNLSSFNIFAPSDFDSSGFGWVSRNIPFIPLAIPALDIVSIISGFPDVIPFSWFGDWSESDGIGVGMNCLTAVEEFGNGLEAVKEMEFFDKEKKYLNNDMDSLNDKFRRIHYDRYGYRIKKTKICNSFLKINKDLIN